MAAFPAAAVQSCWAVVLPGRDLDVEEGLAEDPVEGLEEGLVADLAVAVHLGRAVRRKGKRVQTAAEIAVAQIAAAELAYSSATVAAASTSTVAYFRDDLAWVDLAEDLGEDLAVDLVVDLAEDPAEALVARAPVAAAVLAG